MKSSVCIDPKDFDSVSDFKSFLAFLEIKAPGWASLDYSNPSGTRLATIEVPPEDMENELLAIIEECKKEWNGAHLEWPTSMRINSDVSAFLEREEAEYSGSLIVMSETLDDYDVYTLNEDGEWAIAYDSLTNRSVEGPTAVVPSIFEAVKGFEDWANEMKKLLQD